MNILVTGAKGFVGKNLISRLSSLDGYNVFEFDIDTKEELLNEYVKNCDFVFHLAGVNRPENQEEFMKGNFGFTSKLLETLKKHDNKAPVLITSSIQAKLKNPYGISKKAGEDLILEYGKENNVSTKVYRLPNVFGKWCRPNYNSVVATFCHNIAHDLEIKINDPNTKLTLVYIDDVIDEFLRALNNEETRKDDYCFVPVTHEVLLGEIADLLYKFKNSRNDLSMPFDDKDSFAKKLYATYLSYLPKDNFAYDLLSHKDDRGSFTEVLRLDKLGQVSVNISKPHIVKGNHWHHTKNEKFLVVKGNGVIRLRKIDSDEIIEYYVSDKKLQVVDIIPGYTHNIENLGEEDMVTIMWANEPFDSNKPDTYYLEV